MQLQRSFGITPKSPISNYDALHDKFAAFYFNGYGVKKHLKKLRKAIECEPYKKGNKQYTQKIAKKLTEIETDQKKLQQKIKPYEQSLKPSSLQKLKQMQTFMHQNKKKKLQIDAQEDSPNKLNKHMMSSLPKIEHSNRINSRITQLPSQTASSLQKIKEKDLKSISIADKSTNNKTHHKFQVYKNRSNQSLHTRKILKMRTQEPIVYKEVKHQDFVNFLKKRQEDLLQKSSKLKEVEINQYELEEFQ